MATHASPQFVSSSDLRSGGESCDVHAHARRVLLTEAQALTRLAEQLDDKFAAALACIAACRGHVVVTGVGKSGLVGQKISATLASTGCPSFFLHAAEAIHGDLGRIRSTDVVMALSHSGESTEVVALLSPLKAAKTTLVAMTGRPESTLGRAADHLLSIGQVHEACPMGLVPTTSTTAMMGLGDALAMALMQQRGRLHALYARLHPGGQLGRQLRTVGELMRRGDALPLASATAPLREVLRVMTETRGRPGAAILVSPSGALAGVFTDGDLRRLLEQSDFSVDCLAHDVMHAAPKTVAPDDLAVDAMALLRHHRIDQVPVIDGERRPIGLLDVQDVLSLNVP